MLANIVRGPGFIRGALRSAASVASMRWSHHDAPHLPDPDAVAVMPNLVQNLRGAGSSNELFEIVSLKRKEFSAEHVMHALKRLFHLQKQDNTSIPNKHILRNPDFEHLCRNLKHVARQLDVNDIIEAMKILNFVGVPPNSEISMTLLHLVRHQINDISLGQIVFLEFLMGRFESTPLVDALRIALPMLMQIQLATKLDHDNPAQLCDLLQFATRNTLSEQACTSIVVALTLHGTELSLDQARSIVWSLCDLKQPFGETHERLLHNCLEVLCDSLLRLPFNIVETTLTKMTAKYSQQRVAAFYDEEFYARCAQYTITKDVGFLNALYVQRKFNRINYVSIELIEYMTEKACADPELLSDAPPTTLLTYIAALSTPYYRPIAWDALKASVRANAFVRGPPRANMPWLRFVLELIALDLLDVEHVNAICAPDFLKQQLARNQNTLDMLQLLLLHQVTELLLPADYAGHRLPDNLVEKVTHIQLQRQEMPLRATMRRVFGERVLSGVVTRYGHFVDHVVVFDGEGKVVPQAQQEIANASDSDGEEATANVRFEDIQLGAGERMVAVVAYPLSHYCLNVPRLKGMFHLRVRTLEALGVPVCVINADAWAELPDREKLDFVEREVRHKLA